MNTGKFGAYKQLTPPNSDLSGVINQQELFNNAANLKKEQKAEKDRKDKLAKSTDLASINSGKKTQYLNFEHSLTDAFRRKGGLIDKYSEAQARLQANPSDSEAAGILSNIKMTVKKIAFTKDSILKYDRALSEGIANGNISKHLNEGYTANLGKIKDGDVFFDIDDFGNATIKNTGNVDFDGDGIDDVITLDSLSDKNNFGVWEADFDLKTFNSALKENYGEKVQTELNPDNNNPFLSRKTKGFDTNNTLSVKEDYKTVFGASKENLTTKGRSILNQFGISAKKITPEQYNEFLNQRVKEFQAQYATEKTDKIDRAAQANVAKAWADANRGGEDDKSKNSLRTTVDGILAGDERFLTSLKDQKIEEQGSDDVYVIDVEYSNGIITLEINNGAVKKIDTSNKEKAIAEVLKLVRPNGKVDQREEEYRKGVSEVKYKESENKISLIQVRKKVDEFPETMESEKFIKFLTKEGIKGFKDDGGYFGNKVILPNGTKLDSKTKTDMVKIKKYLKENWSELTAEKTEPKPEPKSGEKKSFIMNNVPEGGF